MTQGAVSGRCYCGSIRFKLKFPTDFCSHCHCEDCRLSHSAAFVTWTSVPRAQFEFTSGEAKLKKFESHSGIRWEFCGDCGSSMLYESDQTPNTIYVTLASLEGPIDRKPEAHVSAKEMPAWSKQSHLLPRFRGKTNELIGESRDH